MALGTPSTRLANVAQTIRQVDRILPADSRPALGVYRFGESFSAVEPSDSGIDWSAVAPTDRDTQLLAALRQLPGRFVPSPPQAVVLFSDGRAQDPTGLEEMARRYARMKVPIHVVPFGDPSDGGDVAIVNVVAPARVRKHSIVNARVWVRSYGYDGKRTQLRLSALGGDDAKRPLNRLPITLKSGIQSFNLTFQADLRTMHIEASVPPQADEVSQNNNAATADVAVDRTKIRVLYVEGSTEPTVQRIVEGRTVITDPSSYFAEGLAEDPDIECLILRARPGSSRLQPVFVNSPAALFAFDAIVLSDVGKRVFRDRELQWIEQWISQRGGGLCMIGGPRSFAAGGWPGSLVADMLPVVMDSTKNDWSTTGRLSVRPKASSALHPIWNIVSDAKQNEEIISSLPTFLGANRVADIKPAGTVVAVANLTGSAAGSQPIMALGPYGSGRTLAVTTGLTPRWAADFVKRWGVDDNRYYAKFWRNVIYWLSENSANGRRRLTADVDKMSYQPGETIKLQAVAYDEASNRATGCRVSVIIEPQSATAELDSDYAPVGWPDDVQRTSGEEGPYVAWGEELEMIERSDDGQYEIELPIADTPTQRSATQALRIEISAYEDYTLIDSTSLDVQILDDPFEAQNPLPDHELLSRIASLSGGKVLSDARSLAAAIDDLPAEIGPPEVHKVPLWSRWWLLILLLLLLTVEWTWRRSMGLA